MKTKQTKLIRYASTETVLLKDAISNCQSALVSAVSLLYSPQSCVLARLNADGLIVDVHDRKVDLTRIFEARLFNEQCELRWLNRLEGYGDAVLITESEQDLKAFEEIDQQSCEPLEQQYLLWGEPAKNQPEHPDWQRLAEARIGKLDIPLSKSLEPNQRVFLKSREYLFQTVHYGNIAVIEERLVKLEEA